MELEGRPVIRPAHAGVWRWVAECRMGREECHNLSVYGWKRRACLMMRIPQAAKCISLQTERAARPTTKQAYHAPRDAKL